MANHILRPLILGALLITASLGAAGQLPAQGDGWIGLGVGIQPLTLADDADVVALLAPGFYLPVRLGDRLMVEPSFGFLRWSRTATTPSWMHHMTVRAVTPGVGLLVLGGAGAEGRVYAGPRVSLVYLSSEYRAAAGGSSETASRRDLVMAGVAGGEFFLAERFSLGGEVGLEYRRQGAETGSGTPDGEHEETLVRTTGEFRARWYFR